MSVNGSRNGIEIHQLLPKMLYNTSRVSSRSTSKSASDAANKRNHLTAAYIAPLRSKPVWLNRSNISLVHRRDSVNGTTHNELLWETQFVCGISRVQLKSIRSLLCEGRRGLQLKHKSIKKKLVFFSSHCDFLVVARFCLDLTLRSKHSIHESAQSWRQLEPLTALSDPRSCPSLIYSLWRKRTKKPTAKWKDQESHEKKSVAENREIVVSRECETEN